MFDLTTGWNGKPAAASTRSSSPINCPRTGSTPAPAPFTFVDDVEKAVAAAKDFAGDRDVDVAAGQIVSQAPKLGPIDQVIVNLVSVVFGSGRPFFATGTLPSPRCWRTRPR